MRDRFTAPKKHIRQVQDTEKARKSQNARIFVELFKKPLNSKMLHLLTGIPREAITRRKRELEDAGRLKVVYKDYCPVTGHLVQFLSTNPEVWAKFNQKN